MLTELFPLASKSVLGFFPSHLSLLHLLHLIFTDVHRRPFCSYLLKHQYHYQCPVVADLTCVPRILPSSRKPPMPIPTSFIFFLYCLCPVSQVWVHWAKIPFQWQTLQILIIITTLWLLSIFLKEENFFSYDSNKYNPLLIQSLKSNHGSDPLAKKLKWVQVSV